MWPGSSTPRPAHRLWECSRSLRGTETSLVKERYEAERKDRLARGALVGKPSWGYTVVGDKLKTLAPDPALVPYVRGIMDRAMRGDSS